MTNDVIWLIVLAFFFAKGFVQTGLGDRVAVRLLPIRPRSRGARRSLRTFPVVTLHPRFPFNV
jgi:di/tricarboxylate transporter